MLSRPGGLWLEDHMWSGVEIVAGHLCEEWGWMTVSGGLCVEYGGL